MIVFIVIGVAMPLLCAAYVGGYERAAYRGRYDGCHGQDGYQALLRRPRPAEKGDGKDDAQKARPQNEVVPGEPLDKPIAIACQANAIMRAGMHVQVMTYIGSLVPLAIGLLAGLIGLWTFIDDLKKRASAKAIPVSGNVRVAPGVIAETDVACEGPLGSEKAVSERGGTGSVRHHDLVDAICLVAVATSLVAKLGRRSSGRPAG